MDKTTALKSLAALAQETRLDVFRLLVTTGCGGLAAGEVSARLGVRQNTMSAHLGVLARGRLVRRFRDGRVIRYSADYDGMRELLTYLMQDCCRGEKAICEPVVDAMNGAMP